MTEVVFTVRWIVNQRGMGLVGVQGGDCVARSDFFACVFPVATYNTAIPSPTPNSARTCGAVAQLGERLNGIQEVVGSIPSGSTIYFNDLLSATQVYFQVLVV
jgi:hypothetical protein